MMQTAVGTYEGGIVQVAGLTMFASYLNEAIDTGKFPDVSIADIKERIHDGTLFEYLHEVRIPLIPATHSG